MTALSDAVAVETLVDIDWGQLGRHFGEHLTSRDQAAFLMGFYETVGDLQLAWIGAEPTFNADRREVALVLDALASHIRGGA